MLVYIFKGAGRVFGFTENATALNLPTQYGPWRALETMELPRDGQPTVGVDSEACLNDIDSHGFHLTDVHAPIAESA
jgi:hypothetical protein